MKVITIGRNHQNDVVINAPSVSRHHCQMIQDDNGQFRLVDFGSKNGTYINGRRITGEVILNYGDTIRIGNTTLPWQNYFSLPVQQITPNNKTPNNNMWWWIGSGIAAAITAILVTLGILFGVQRNEHARDILFTGEYPPVKTITYTENGESYDIEAVSGHVLMFFTDGTSHSKSKKLIEQYGGKIIEQMPKYDYYLVEVSAGAENSFITQMRQEQSVEYVFLNTVSYPNAVYIIDHFNGEDSHGKKVRDVYEKNRASGSKNNIYEMSGSATLGESVEYSISNFMEIGGDYAIANATCKRLLQIMDNADETELVLINRSLGFSLFPKRTLYSDVSTSKQKSYRKSYELGLEKFASCFMKIEKNGKTNFLLLNASGNEGVYNLDVLVLNELLNTKKADILQRHLILVNAVDDWNKKSKGIRYSNNTLKKNDLTTTIDISDPTIESGTSFAAPKLLGWIDKITNEYDCLNAQDVLQIIRKVTPVNSKQALNYNDLEKEAKNIAINKGCEQEKENEYIDFTGHWATSDFNFQLSLNQAGNRISGTTHSNDHGGDVSDVQYNLSGTISGDVATVNYYSDYWEQNMQGNIKYLAEDQIEWTQIPQKGRDMPGKTILYRYTPVQAVISHEEQERLYDEMEKIQPKQNNSLVGTKWIATDNNGWTTPDELDFINSASVIKTYKNNWSGEIKTESSNYYYNTDYREWRFGTKTTNQEPFRLKNNNTILEIYTWHMPGQPVLREYKRIN